ncbi:hypothetical protein [Flavobacterium frigidarium]
MPLNALQFFYECENCKTVLKPNAKKASKYNCKKWLMMLLKCTWS